MTREIGSFSWERGQGQAGGGGGDLSSSWRCPSPATPPSGASHTTTSLSVPSSFVGKPTSSASLTPVVVTPPPTPVADAEGGLATSSSSSSEPENATFWDKAKRGLKKINSKCTINYNQAGRWPILTTSFLSSPSPSLPTSPLNHPFNRSSGDDTTKQSISLPVSNQSSRRGSLNTSQPIEIPSRRRNSSHAILSRSPVSRSVNYPVISSLDSAHSSPANTPDNTSAVSRINDPHGDPTSTEGDAGANSLLNPSDGRVLHPDSPPVPPGSEERLADALGDGDEDDEFDDHTFDSRSVDGGRMSGGVHQGCSLEARVSEEEEDTYHSGRNILTSSSVPMNATLASLPRIRVGHSTSVTSQEAGRDAHENTEAPSRSQGRPAPPPSDTISQKYKNFIDKPIKSKVGSCPESRSPTSVAASGLWKSIISTTRKADVPGNNTDNLVETPASIRPRKSRSGNKSSNVGDGFTKSMTLSEQDKWRSMSESMRRTEVADDMRRSKSFTEVGKKPRPFSKTSCDARAKALPEVNKAKGVTDEGQKARLTSDRKKASRSSAVAAAADLSRSLPDDVKRLENFSDVRRIKGALNKAKAARNFYDGLGKTKNFDGEVRTSGALGNFDGSTATGGNKTSSNNRASKQATSRVGAYKQATTTVSGKKLTVVKEETNKSSAGSINILPISGIDKPAADSVYKLTTDITDQPVVRKDSADNRQTVDSVDKPVPAVVDKLPTDKTEDLTTDVDKSEVWEADRSENSCRSGCERDAESRARICQSWDSNVDAVDDDVDRKNSGAIRRVVEERQKMVGGQGMSRSWHLGGEESVLEKHLAQRSATADHDAKGGARKKKTGRGRVNRNWDFDGEDFDALDRKERSNAASEEYLALEGRGVNRSWDLDEEAFLDDCFDRQVEDGGRVSTRMSRSWHVGEGGGGVLLHDPASFRNLCGRRNGGHDSRRLSRKGEALRRSWDESHDSILDYFSPKSYDAADVKWETSSETEEGKLGGTSWELSEESVPDDYFSVRSYGMESETGDWSLNVLEEDDDDLGRRRTRSSSTSSEDDVVSGNRASKGVVASDEYAAVSSSVGEDPSRYLRAARLSQYKGGSLTNIHDPSGRGQRHAFRDSRGSSKSLSNLHDCFRNSLTNLGNLGREGFGSVRNIKDKLADRKGSRRHKGSWSSSNLTREGVSGSVSHWGSNPRIYGGKEALRRSMLDCSTWESPREASEILEERETEKRRGHGWEKLRGKVLEKRGQAGVDATGGEAFQEGGGEGESEWVLEREKNLPKTAERRWERLVHKVLDTKGKGRTERAFREGDEGSDWMSGEENVPRKPSSSSRGWDKLRQKVLQETRRLHTSSSCRRMVKEGHADGGNLKAGVTDASPNRSPNRPPKFSEIFGGVEELRKVREQMKLMESTPVDAREEEEEKKKKKKRKKRRSERRGGKDGAEGNEGAVGRWKYATSGAASLSCGANLNNFKLEVVADVEEEPRDNAEDKTPSHEVSPESGLGSSFEDETPGSSSTSQASSNPPSPTAPRKVFDAITHYFRTVDLVDNEDGLDSFNREAEVIDPDDLMLLTDNEDAFTWHDLILPCDDERGLESGHVQDAYQELQLNFSTGGDVNVWDNKVDLDQLLGGDYPSLQWDMPEATRSSSTQPGPATEPAGDLAGSFDTVVGQEEDTSEIEGLLQQPDLVPDQGLETTEDKEKVEDEFNTSHETSSNSFENVTSDDKERDESCTSLGDITSSLQTTSSEGAAEEEEDNALAPAPPPEAAAGADDAAAETRGRSRTREKPERQRSATSGERSVSCSDNIRAFLQSQPCAHAHQEGVEHPGCSDKHVLESSTSVETHHLPGGNVEEAPTTKKTTTKKTKRRYPDSPRPPLRQYNSTSRPNTSFWSRLFCTAPVTVEGLAPDLESHDTDPEPLPPPIPPHGVDPSSVTEVQPTPTSQPEDPEVMTADEAQRLLSANILEGKVRESQSLLSDEEAQEVVLLLSPQEQDASKVAPPVPQHFSDTPPAVPPHYTEAAPPIPPHYTPGEDEYDTRVASHFDPSLTSPLSPEDEPSEADSSEASGDVYQVSRVKEVLVEDGVHYLEDGHFWVEVPGLPEEDEDDDNDPSMPYHPHTKLTFSKDPVQVFSTYSVTEYDRKNDEVDPVAASAEYELEKRVEKMDLFPVEIVKGEGGLGLSIIGMGVGADAGVEKLGIFVKTITQGGATERDGRIQVNDQIIEVDGKSLVGVTQVFAASVLKNTSGRVHFLIGREKDPENSEVALLIKQSLQADREREERRRALGGPDYDPHTGQSLFDPLSSPSEENSRSEDVSVQHNYSSYLEGGSSPTSPDATSPPPEVFDLEGDTSDTSPDNDVAVLKLKLKEVQYRNAVAEAEITKLKMSLLEMEKVVTENTKYTSQLLEAQNKMADLDTQLQSKHSEVSTYQDMLEQSQGQFIVLEKKYYKAKKIIKEYQGRERDFLHREEYHITQLEEKDSHYNALVKALKDRVIHLEAELTSAQKKAGLPIQVPSDTSTQPAYWNLQQNTQSALAKQPPRKPSLCTLDPEISDTETSDTGTSEGEKANTVERKIPVKEELDEAVPPHELLDVSASRAKGELASRGGLANRHLPSLKKTTSMSSASSQEQSLDDSSLDDDLPEAVKHPPVEAAQDGQQDQGSRRSAETQESPLPPHSPSHTTSSITYAKSPQPPSYTQATMGNVSHLGSPPPYLHPPGQFGSPRQPFTSSHVSSDPSSGLPTRPLGAGIDSQSHESRSESRPEIPYRHPPPVARVQPVNRAEISESTTLASHLANRTPQQQSLAEQLKALLAERELESDATQQRNDREASPSKRSPTSLMEDVRQAVMQADVTSHVVSGQLVHQVSPPQRSQSSFYSTGGRESVRDSNAGSQSPRIGRGSLHASPGSGVSASPSGVVLLSQRPLDSSLPTHKLAPGVDGSSGDLSSGPASLGSGDEGSGASLGSQSSLSHTHPPTERTKRSHMWQTAPVVDWTKEQVSQWLVVQGLESCVGRFQDVGMTGPRLLNLDVRDLKALGLPTEEKTKLKRKVKELRIAVEKERKQAEKEKKEREKLQKKAEKLAEKAEKKKK